MANTPNINLVKPLGTDKALVSVLNDNSDKIDSFAGSTNTSIGKVESGMAIVVNGNNAPKAITAGQYLFIKNHSTLSAGGYHATANIANGAAITSSNVAADADGVVNGAFSALNSKIAPFGKTILSGSLHDILTSGVYYIGTSVTDKPSQYGGAYLCSVYDNNQVAGIYISAIDDSAYTVRLRSGTWYTKQITLT